MGRERSVMRTGIYGAGSLGTILGAYMTRAGVAVDLINRNRAHIEALREQGAHVTGTVSFSTPVTALLPDEMEGEYDVLILLTKQQQNPEVVASLLPHLSKNGVICTLQNGLPEPGIAEIVGDKRVLGCTVEWGATLIAPGVSELTSEPDSMSMALGSFAPGNDEKLAEVKALLETMCPVNIEENFMGVRWSKLLINAAFSGVSTALGTTFGGAAEDKRSRRIVQRVIKECIDVAQAEGVSIAPVQGKDIVKLMNYRGAIKKKISFMIIPMAMKKHRLLKASMLQDLEKNKLTEVDAINGVVCARGRAVGVPTPMNDKVVQTIHEIEEGKYPPRFENVALFEEG